MIWKGKLIIKKIYLLIYQFISSIEMKRNYGQTVSVHSGSATRAPMDVEKPTGEDRPNVDDGARDRPDPQFWRLSWLTVIWIILMIFPICLKISDQSKWAVTNWDRSDFIMRSILRSMGVMW